MILERIALRSSFAEFRTPPEAEVARLAEELLERALDQANAFGGAVYLAAPEPPAMAKERVDGELPRELLELVWNGSEALRLATAGEVGEQLLIPLRHQLGPIGVLQVVFAHGRSVGNETLAALLPLIERFAAAHERARLGAMLERERRARLDAETVLRETTSMLVKHQQVGRMGDFRFNTRTRQSFASLECYKLFGLDPTLAVVDFEVWAEKIIPEDRQRTVDELTTSVANLLPMNFEYRVVLDGQIRRLQCMGDVDRDHHGDLYYYGVLTDVTERRETEAALRRQQSELENALRLASLGELAGSIIHEINQPLTAIAASAEASLRWLAHSPPELDEAREAAEGAVRDVHRVVAVMNGLRSLVRGSDLRRSRVRINDLLRDVLAMTRVELDRARIRAQVELEDVPEVDGDVTQLQQAIFNLLRNAIDVLKLVAGRERLLTLRSVVDGDGVRVSIVDVGDPISPAQQAKLFEPLFTTKVDGLGFGLTITRKIVLAHGGRIWAEPMQPFGMAVHLVLPRL